MRVVQKMDAEGIPKVVIARELGMSRNTVRRLLRFAHLPGKRGQRTGANRRVARDPRADRSRSG